MAYKPLIIKAVQIQSAEVGSRRHRAEILGFLGVRRLTRRDLADAFAFAADKLCPRGMTPGALMDRLISWFFERKIECPSEDELVRVSGGARRRF
jgi:Domain of unknown function (DUF4158)